MLGFVAQQFLTGRIGLENVVIGQSKIPELVGTDGLHQPAFFDTADEMPQRPHDQRDDHNEHQEIQYKQDADIPSLLRDHALQGFHADCLSLPGFRHNIIQKQTDILHDPRLGFLIGIVEHHILALTEHLLRSKLAVLRRKLDILYFSGKVLLGCPFCRGDQLHRIKLSGDQFVGIEKCCLQVFTRFLAEGKLAELVQSPLPAPCLVHFLQIGVYILEVRSNSVQPRLLRKIIGALPYKRRVFFAGNIVVGRGDQLVIPERNLYRRVNDQYI